ncbi:MAG: hypothetical protein ACM35H_08965 [Bacteroidota bacterium]|nr:hypothetical protein [Kiloniellaceae bacterium]
MAEHRVSRAEQGHQGGFPLRLPEALGTFDQLAGRNLAEQTVQPRGSLTERNLQIDKYQPKNEQ